MINTTNYLPSLLQLVRQMRENILDFYEHSSQYPVHAKSDSSPLTQADIVAHQMIMAGLEKISPDIPMLSEEGVEIAYATRQQWQRYWLVDPIDGTKEFIRHSGDFTINIALIEKHRPVLGLIYVPVTDLCYFAIAGQGAFKQVGSESKILIHSRPCAAEHVTIAIGRHYKKEKLKSLLISFPSYDVFEAGSALKFCLLAEGKADIYPRLGITCEWDTAAGQIILEEAGGAVVDFDLNPLQYNLKDSLLNPHFIAVGDSTTLLPRLKDMLNK